MKTNIGLWIDHRTAIVVSIIGKSETIIHIQSNVEKQPGRFDGKRSTTPFESQMIQKDDKLQRILSQELKAFYTTVLPYLMPAESILILGPGEAKGELKKLIDSNNHTKTIVVIEAADKMTEKQISAQVHHYFANKNV